MLYLETKFEFKKKKKIYSVKVFTDEQFIFESPLLTLTVLELAVFKSNNILQHYSHRTHQCPGLIWLLTNSVILNKIDTGSQKNIETETRTVVGTEKKITGWIMVTISKKKKKWFRSFLELNAFSSQFEPYLFEIDGCESDHQSQNESQNRFRPYCHSCQRQMDKNLFLQLFQLSLNCHQTQVFSDRTGVGKTRKTLIQIEEREENEKSTCLLKVLVLDVNNLPFPFSMIQTQCFCSLATKSLKSFESLGKLGTIWDSSWWIVLGVSQVFLFFLCCSNFLEFPFSFPGSLPVFRTFSCFSPKFFFVRATSVHKTCAIMIWEQLRLMLGLFGRNVGYSYEVRVE